MTWSDLAVVVFAALSVVASSLRGSANGLITQEQYTQVARMRAPRHAAGIVFVLCVAALLGVLVSLRVNPGRFGLYAVITIIVCAVVWSHITYFRNLRTLHLPAAYIAAVRRARIVLYCGGLAYLVIRVFFEPQPG